jgi:putative transcriptional regulator
MTAKPKLFDELIEGVRAMKGHRQGRLTLRTYKIEPAPLPKVDSKLIRDTRRRLRCSRAVFARKLRINERTLEKWEQGRAKPNPQAAALALLVGKFPVGHGANRRPSNLYFSHRNFFCESLVDLNFKRMETKTSSRCNRCS